MPLLRWIAACSILTAIAGASDGVQASGPLLISEPTSTRGIALESITFTQEPFALNSPLAWSADRRTRVMMFALGLTLQPGDDLSVVSADAEDAAHFHYSLTVESVAPVDSFPWMSQVILRLSDDLGDVGDVLVVVRYHGVASNRVRIGIGHVGGGPPDDQGAVPTPVWRTIKGRITTGASNGIEGIKVTLSGSAAATATTDSAGNYSFTSLLHGGNYTITPSIDQDYYVFSPANRSISNLVTDQNGDFTAALAPFPNPANVLEFDGSPKTVDYGNFWPYDVDLGHFFWEFWAMPGDNAGGTYMLSDGYGGAHALLFGVSSFNSYEPGRYILFGDIFDGTTPITFFASDQGPAPGEWAHFAVGWDGTSIITYYNGVPVGKTAFAGPRRSPGYYGGGGRLLIGGSDHSNFIGRIAQVRGYEGSNPRADVNPLKVEAAFVPQTVFGVGANLLSYYFRAAPQVADLSNGYDVGGGVHVGVPRGTTSGILFDCGSCPPPQFVIDPTAPNFSTGAAAPPVNTPTPTPVPSGALVFDSFSRTNSTYTFGAAGGIGSTEGGTAGPRVWQTNQGTSTLKPFGILNGRGVLLGDDRYVTWIPTGSSTGNLDVRVDRHLGVWGSGVDTGLAFRVADAANYFFTYTVAGASGPRRLSVGYYQNGQRTNLLVTRVDMPSDWTTLRAVTTSNGDIKVYADGTLVYSGNSGLMATASGAGLYNNSSGMGLVNRWDNFSVFVAP